MDAFLCCNLSLSFVGLQVDDFYINICMLAFVSFIYSFSYSLLFQVLI
jgi:hypothetical protein